MKSISQRNRESRTVLNGSVEFRHDFPEGNGQARWTDVSRCGAAVRLGRYLRPGRQLWLSTLVEGEILELRAQVVWCNAVSHDGDYAAGLLIYRETPEAALTFSRLGHAARCSNSPGELQVTEKPVWNLFPHRLREQALNGLAQARAV